MASGVLLNLHMMFDFQGTQPAPAAQKSFFPVEKLFIKTKGHFCMDF